VSVDGFAIDRHQWWAWVPNANWRRPFGPGSDIAGKTDHPVVQVAYADAAAYAPWAGRRLPTEAERDTPRAAAPAPPIRGVKRSPRGEADGEYLAGSIPVPQRRRRRVDRDVARRLIPPQWFWARRHDRQCLGVDHHRYLPHHQTLAASTPCCGPNSDPGVNQTLKGGSRLCAPQYCHRYRPAARSPQSQDSATTHIGFRCVADLNSTSP
jgi:formylglycine-generating enzyme